MTTAFQRIHPPLLALLTLVGLTTSTLAQEVTIPDPGLNAAIREALQKPDGPLSQEDLLDLTDLSAISANITNLQGLEAARNLETLFLDDNQLTGLAFPNVLTNLTSLSMLFLNGNPLATLTIPGGLTNLSRLDAQVGGLTSLTLPAALPSLSELRLGFNQLSSLTLPGGMTNLSVLSLFVNQLTNLTLPADLTNLGELNLNGNLLSTLTLPASLSKLAVLIVGQNQLTSFTLPASMTNLTFLRLNDNQLTNVDLPDGLNRLSFLVLAGNQLEGLTLPLGMTNLSALFLQNNQLTNLTLPADLHHAFQIDLTSNKLAHMTWPPGLAHLSELDLAGNQLTNLTLPPDLTNLTSLKLDGNPLTTFVLSEPMAAGSLADVVDSLQNQGVSIFTYPLTVQLLRPRPGAFQFGIVGPPGVYAVLASSDLTAWSQVGLATNAVGAISFVDTLSHLFPKRFYRAVPFIPPTNMVFVPPNTFTMGSPTTEQGRDPNEGPQTIVTLTRGFWIGKFEVTQGEYVSVMNTNPSFFPGDLTRPVETVSWPEATNYCAKLTERELATGHIPPGSRYRLPTEAEWECAARAGTTTRFSYGDDPDYASLTNYAWYAPELSDLTTHPVGQKLPNPWGLYDMVGNVWEWTQDWLGDLPGGEVTDPTGPPSNAIGWKVVRGGSYDFGGSDCRSARRFFFGSHPALNDSDLGFRVVLAIEPE